MFQLISIASLALSAVVAVNGAAVPRRDAIAARHAAIARDESSYNAAVLEPYSDYISRYWAIGCPSKHQTQYFDLCCHPMKKGETLARNREPQCDPANLPSSVSSAAPAPTPSDDGDDDGDCDDGGDEETTTASPVPSVTPSAVPPPVTSSAAPPPPPATSSAAPVNVAPEPPKEPVPTKASSSSVHTTKTPAPTPTPAPAPAPAPAPSSQGFSGQGTWFTQNGVAGACGKVHSDNDFIVALDERKYGNPGQQSQFCGKSLTITNKATGKTATATVADDCPTCGHDTDLDMSVGLFKALTGDLGIGLFDIEWHFNN